MLESSEEVSSAMVTIIAPKLTYQDLRAMPDDGKRYELIDGEVYMTPSPNRRHQEIVGKLHVLLYAFVQKRDLGKIYLAPLDVVFDESNVVQPDLVFIRKERLSILKDAGVFGAPDLAIEVLSPGTAKFDRETKLQVYARAGVPELWYVDPEAESVEILNLTDEHHYALTAHLSDDKALVSAALPGIPLTLRQIFT
jgi:Uma2 family endonuclease